MNPEEYISSNDFILDNEPFGEQVIGYASLGIHAPMQELYILELLNFQFAKGAIFNTIESFNGWSFGFGRAEQGLISDFIHTGGTGGGGTVYEPFLGGQTQDEIMFSAYSIGYSLVDAAYQSFPYIAWQNTIVGDPLTRIFECENTVISSNTTIGPADFDCDVTVPIGITLTIASGTTVNFNKNAELKIYGNLVLTEGSVINFNNYSELELHGSISGSGNVAYLNFNQRGNLNLIVSSDFNNLFLTFNDESEFILAENIFASSSSDNEMIFNDESKLRVYGTFNNNENGMISFNEGSNLLVYGTMNINENSSSTFNNQSRLEVTAITSTLNINENSVLNFSGSSILGVATLVNIFPGAILNFNDDSFITATGNFNCQGVASNQITFNFTNSNVYQFRYSGGNTLLIDQSIFNNGELLIDRSHHMSGAESITITNSTFIGCQRALLFVLNENPLTNPAYVANCDFINITEVGIDIQQVSEIQIEHCTITLNSSETSKGIRVRNNGEVLISNVHISNGAVGITSYQGTQEDPEIIETLVTDIEINQCIIETGLGISFSGQHFPISSINIYGNHFENILNGISVNDFSNVTLNVSDNIMTGYSNGDSEVGISLMNGNLVPINYNRITNFQTGIYLSSVTSPLVINNYISASDLTSVEGPGIFAESSNGKIRKNTIQYHNIGIELGGSSPMVSENFITGNLQYGLYASSDSHPDLGLTLIGPVGYPLTGYNSIYDNGICDLMQNPEIYISKSTIDLESGCNTIADDREDDPVLNCDFLYLIDGHKVLSEINAIENYWGNHPVYGNNPEGRFGPEVTIDYSHFLDGPCSYSQGEEMLLLTTSSGEVYDTVYSTGVSPSEPTDLQSRYASANEYYYNHQYTEAKQEYSGIIQDYGNERSSLKAYNKMLTIEKQINSSPETFQELKTFYIQKVNGQTDSIMISTLTHLSNLCLVAAGEYETAIDNFDQIVQQNPNSDIALYREIDALTTALLISSDSTLGKQAAGKYYVSDMNDYNSRVKNLLRNRKGSGTENDKEQIPTEYTLYQNFPNPFNPTTTIKYDLPKSGNIELVIYDILGRKVKTLVNETREAGRYEVKWDASSVSSGVYIYQLRSEDYINTKKMILLR